MKKNIQNTKSRWCRIGLLLVSCFALNQGAQAQVLINENFSSANNLVPPAGWANVDNGGSNASQIWTFNNPGDRNITGGSPGFGGNFAILDSDDQGSSNDQNADLITPEFDASQPGSYLLEFDNNWEQCCEAVGRVEVWDGTQWNVIESMPNSGSGNGSGDGDEDPSTHKSIYFTSLTSSNVAKIRFHYEGSWDYWWAIDNVKITRLSCSPAQAVYTVVPDCNNGQFSVSVDISSLGSASSVAITEGATTFATATVPGTYIAGPFAAGSMHTLTLENNTDADCNIVSPVQSYNGCPATNDECEEAILLTAGPTCVPSGGTTLGATALSDIPSCSTADNGDVWFKFVATSSSSLVTVDNVSPDNPAALFLFYGVAAYAGHCGAMVPLECGTGEVLFGTSPAEVTVSGVNVGDTVYVQVWNDESYDDFFELVNTNLTFNICVTALPDPPASCATLLAPANTAANVVANPYPVFTWNAVPGATGYRFYLGEDVANASEITSGPDTTVSISGLSYSTTYFWYVVPFNDGGDATGCDASAFSFTTEATPAPPANDDATGAISLIVGAPCSGAVYSNISATLNTSGTTNEPYPYCHTNSTGEHSVWFSFTAPSSGAVKITTDNGAAGSLNDTKIGLFSATTASDYSTFTILACDDDNGRNNDTTDYLSTIFATGLSQGTTYYIEVDGYANDDEGTFCLQVQEINPTMISNSASCADIVSPLGNETTYDGWVTLLDEAGNLVALVRNPAGGEAGDFSGSYNIDGNGFGMPRQDGNGTYYLSRNYTINNSGISTPVDVQLFFHMGEIATLTGVTQGATTLGNLNVTKQESTNCDANFLESNGATSVLLQNNNGSVNGVSWIQVSTSSFSNFYLMGGEFPLYVELKGITATNDGGKNRVDWSTAKENKGDYFELERSADGRNFSFLATIAGKGQPSAYTYWDNDPVLGVNYYRLKVINVDKKPFYSSVVTATVDHLTAFSMQAYPNPVNNSLILEIGGTREADANLIITDATGRTLRTIPVTEARVKLDMSSLAQGLYLIQYKDALNHKTIRVNKL